MRLIWIGIKNRNLNIFGDVLTAYGAQDLSVTVFLVHDQFKDQILERYKVPGDFRSFSMPKAKKVFIFDSPLETYESLSYLLLKELCHISIRENAFLNRLCYKATDKKHQELDFYGSLPETDFCSLLASKAVGGSYNKQVTTLAPLKIIK